MHAPCVGTLIRLVTPSQLMIDAILLPWWFFSSWCFRSCNRIWSYLMFLVFVKFFIDILLSCNPCFVSLEILQGSSRAMTGKMFVLLLSGTQCSAHKTLRKMVHLIRPVNHLKSKLFFANNQSGIGFYLYYLSAHLCHLIMCTFRWAGLAVKSHGWFAKH